MRTVQVISLILVFGLTVSCVRKKGTIEKEPSLDVVPMMNSTNYIEGTVTTEYASDGCNYLIKVMGKDAEQLINPVNLPKKYQKDGAKISFMWTASKAPQTDNCNLGIWASLEIEE